MSTGAPVVHSVRKPTKPVLAVVLSVTLAALAAVVQAGQTPAQVPRDANGAAPAGNARIRGRVLAGDTGLPLARAQVTLTLPQGTSNDVYVPVAGPTRRITLTDAEGRYEFDDVPAGSFVIGASRTGYVNLQYGQRRPYEPGTPVTVKRGAAIDRIDISLPRGAVITARVTDDLGQPVAGVLVRPQRFQYFVTGPRLVSPITGPGPSQTDDRGEVRLFGLMPGEYLLTAVNAFARPDAGTSEGFAPTFYPGVVSASQAAAVSVRVGEEKTVQFPLVTARLARVSGTVVDHLGRPAHGARVWLTGSQPTVNLGQNAAQDGTFTISGVPPDDYAVLVSMDSIEQMTSTLTVVGDDIADLRFTVAPGTTVTGRVVFDGGSPPARMEQVRVTLESLTLASGPGLVPALRSTAVDAEGRFGFTGMSGRVLVDVPARDWMMKSVTVDGQDYVNTPFDLGRRPTLSNVIITLTQRLTTVSGRVSDAAGQAVTHGLVVIVPIDGMEPGVANRRLGATRTLDDGTYAARRLLPGRYAALAVAGLEDGRQYSPEFQQQVRRLGQEFSLREGETVTLNLRVTPDF